MKGGERRTEGRGEVTVRSHFITQTACSSVVEILALRVNGNLGLIWMQLT